MLKQGMSMIYCKMLRALEGKGTSRTGMCIMICNVFTNAQRKDKDVPLYINETVSICYPKRASKKLATVNVCMSLVAIIAILLRSPLSFVCLGILTAFKVEPFSIH